MTTLFVVGFPRSMSEVELKTLFDDFGDVLKVKIIVDRETGLSKGYAFIEFDDEPGAKLAIRDLNGMEIQGRTLNVRFAADDLGHQAHQPENHHSTAQDGKGKFKRTRPKRPRLIRD